jgi:hypothetical protein
MVALVPISALLAAMISLLVPNVDAAAVTTFSHVWTKTTSGAQLNQTQHVTGTPSIHRSTETQSTIQLPSSQAVSGEKAPCALDVPRPIIGTNGSRTSPLPFSESIIHLVPYQYANSLSANSGNMVKRQSTNNFYLKNSEVYYWSLNGMQLLALLFSHTNV